MPTFIDESGEPGSVSPYFRLAAVWLPRLEDTQAFQQGMRGLRKSQGLVEYEFKFSKIANAARRVAYFREALRHPFRFTVASVAKRHPEWRNAATRNIHYACAVTLAVDLRGAYLAEEAARRDATGRSAPLNELVIVDDNKDARYLKIVAESFQGLQSGVCEGKRLVAKVKFERSTGELLQLADMVVGAAGAFIDAPNGEEAACFRLIEERSLGVNHISRQ